MGIFDSLFGGGGSKKVKFDYIPYTSRLPAENLEQGKRIVGDTLTRLEDVASSGETPQSRDLFNLSRQDTLNAFEDASRNAQINLGRVGAGSSTSANQAFDRVMSQLADTLSRQDLVRANALLDRQLSASQTGFTDVLGLSDSTVMVPQMPAPSGNYGGIGSLIGLGAGALAAPFTGGLSLAAGASLGSQLGGSVGSAFQY